MKVFHTQQTAGMSGKSGQGVFTYSGLQGMSYMRTYTYPRITTNNTLRGTEMRNIRAMYNEIEPAYKVQLTSYAAEYANLNNYGISNAKRANGAFALFIKLIFAFYDMDPTHITVATVDLSALALLWPDLDNILSQVQAGLLPSTPNVATYTAAWA